MGGHEVGGGGGGGWQKTGGEGVAGWQQVLAGEGGWYGGGG